MKVKISVETGEETSVFQNKTLMDEAGRAEKFNNLTDALNYFGSKGWRLVQAFPISQGTGLVYNYLFEKKVPKNK